MQSDDIYLDVSINSQSESLRTINHSEVTSYQPVEDALSHADSTSDVGEDFEMDHLTDDVWTHSPLYYTDGDSSNANSFNSLDYVEAFGEHRKCRCLSDDSQTTLDMVSFSSVFDNAEKDRDYSEGLEDKARSDTVDSPTTKCSDGNCAVVCYWDSVVGVGTDADSFCLDSLDHFTMTQCGVTKEDSGLPETEAHDRNSQEQKLNTCSQPNCTDDKFSSDGHLKLFTDINLCSTNQQLSDTENVLQSSRRNSEKQYVENHQTMPVTRQLDGSSNRTELQNSSKSSDGNFSSVNQTEKNEEIRSESDRLTADHTPSTKKHKKSKQVQIKPPSMSTSSRGAFKSDKNCFSSQNKPRNLLGMNPYFVTFYKQA